MGVKGLGKILKNMPDRKVFSSLDSLLNENTDIKYMAIDANLYAYKYAISIGDVMVGFLVQCGYFLSRGIMPVYVVDNFAEYPVEKQLTQERRMRNRKCDTAHFRSNVVEELVQVMRILGIPFIKSPCEADSLCAALCASGKVDACLSDDLDVLVLGGTRIIRKEGSNSFVVYERESVLSYLGDVDDNFLLTMSVLLGCDYSPGMYSLASNTSTLLSIIKECGSNLDEIFVQSEKKQRRNVKKESILKRAFETLLFSKERADESLEDVDAQINTFLTHNVDKKELLWKIDMINSTGRYSKLSTLSFSTISTLARDRKRYQEASTSWR